MALRKLNQFVHFDTDGFFEKIKMVTLGQSVWKDYDTGERKGIKVVTVLTGDRHKYNTADGEVVNNLYEKLIIKVPKEINVPMNVEVRLVNPVATVYGDYRNQLSITADDIEIISK